jgi:hypothetical protein
MMREGQSNTTRSSQLCGQGQVADRSDQRRARARPGLLPVSAGVIGGGGSGGDGIEPGQLTVQDLDGLAVGEGGGIRSAQLVDGGGQVVQ